MSAAEKKSGEALEIIRYHHEKLDGSGYPHGLKGEDIPLVAQVMTVVDIYDALVTDRPYRNALEIKQAFAILRDMATDNKLNASIVEEMIALGKLNTTEPATRFNKDEQTDFMGAFSIR